MFRAYIIGADAIETEWKRVQGDQNLFDFTKVVVLNDLESVPLQDNEVRVRILSFSVEYNVIHMARADPINIVKMLGGKICPGNSFIGEVSEIGKKVKAFKVGDIVTIADTITHDRFDYPVRAWGFDEPGVQGAYAEELVISEKLLMPMPLTSGLNFWQLSALPLKGGVAFHLWRRGESLFRAKVSKERCPLLNVMTFGGGTSELFLMLAKSEGHQTFYCAGNSNRRKTMREMGHQTIDQLAYQRFSSEESIEKFRKDIKKMTDGEGMHVLCDMFRGPLFSAGIAALSREGVNISAGWQLGPKVSYNSTFLSVRQITLDHAHIETRMGLRNATLYYGKVFRPAIHREIYPFEELPRAMNELCAGKHTGIAIVRAAQRMPDSVQRLIP